MTTKKEWAIGIVLGLVLVGVLMMLPIEIGAPAVVILIGVAIGLSGHYGKKVPPP